MYIRACTICRIRRHHHWDLLPLDAGDRWRYDTWGMCRFVEWQTEIRHLDVAVNCKRLRLSKGIGLVCTSEEEARTAGCEGCAQRWRVKRQNAEPREWVRKKMEEQARDGGADSRQQRMHRQKGSQSASERPPAPRPAGSTRALKTLSESTKESDFASSFVEEAGVDGAVDSKSTSGGGEWEQVDSDDEIQSEEQVDAKRRFDYAQDVCDILHLEIEDVMEHLKSCCRPWWDVGYDVEEKRDYVKKEWEGLLRYIRRRKSGH